MLGLRDCPCGRKIWPVRAPECANCKEYRNWQQIVGRVKCVATVQATGLTAWFRGGEVAGTGSEALEDGTSLQWYVRPIDESTLFREWLVESVRVTRHRAYLRCIVTVPWVTDLNCLTFRGNHLAGSIRYSYKGHGYWGTTTFYEYDDIIDHVLSYVM